MILHAKEIFLVPEAIKMYKKLEYENYSNVIPI